jgi:hypothetical protein
MPNSLHSPLHHRWHDHIRKLSLCKSHRPRKGDLCLRRMKVHPFWHAIANAGESPEATPCEKPRAPCADSSLLLYLTCVILNKPNCDVRTFYIWLLEKEVKPDPAKA